MDNQTNENEIFNEDKKIASVVIFHCKKIITRKALPRTK